MTTNMIRVTYVGGLDALKNETAILQEIPGDDLGVRAQFDNLDLAEHLTHGWTRFPKSAFRIHPKTNLENDDVSSD